MSLVWTFKPFLQLQLHSDNYDNASPDTLLRLGTSAVLMKMSNSNIHICGFFISEVWHTTQNINAIKACWCTMYIYIVIL